MRTPDPATPVGRLRLARATLGDRAWLVLLALAVGGVVFANFASGRPADLGAWRGPGQVSLFGLLVALDLMFAFHLYERWIRSFRLPERPMLWAGVAAVVVGLIASHLYSVFLYFPDRGGGLGELVDLRSGMSSFGGILGGGCTAVVMLRAQRLPVLAGLDAMAYGFVGGYVFGRAGCFAIHDHPGIPTEVFLGVVVEGTRRHDLGFYEMLLMLALFAIIHGIARRRPGGAGWALGTFFSLYAPVRFGLDFLRIDDMRHAGLTAGQWTALALFPCGLALLSRALRSRAT